MIVASRYNRQDGVDEVTRAFQILIVEDHDMSLRGVDSVHVILSVNFER